MTVETVERCFEQFSTPNPTQLFFSFVHLDFHLGVLGYGHLVGNPTQTPIAPNPETPMEIQMDK